MNIPEILSNEKILEAHAGEKCRDCGVFIAKAQRDDTHKKDLEQFVELLDGCRYTGTKAIDYCLVEGVIKSLQSQLEEMK